MPGTGLNSGNTMSKGNVFPGFTEPTVYNPNPQYERVTTIFLSTYGLDALPQ